MNKNIKQKKMQDNSQISYEVISKVFSDYENQIFRKKSKFHLEEEKSKKIRRFSENLPMPFKHSFKNFDIKLEGSNKPKNLMLIKIRENYNIKKLLSINGNLFFN